MAKLFGPYKYFLNRLIHTISLTLRTNTYENEVLTRRVLLQLTYYLIGVCVPLVI